MTNIYQTIATAPDEEVWVEFIYYRDHKHMEEVIAKMEKDEDMGQLYKQSLDLITPGTSLDPRGVQPHEDLGFILATLTGYRLLSIF